MIKKYLKLVNATIILMVDMQLCCLIIIMLWNCNGTCQKLQCNPCGYICYPGENTDHNCSYSAVTKSLRDEFAMAVLSGVLCNDPGGVAIENFVEMAYKFADAMLKRRELKWN